LSEYINFFWMPKNGLVPDQESRSGLSGVFCRDLNTALHEIGYTPCTTCHSSEDRKFKVYLDRWSVRIGLSTIYLYHLLSQSSDARPGHWNSANMRLQLEIANAIYHELAHAI
jgi:hypothetical protein